MKNLMIEKLSKVVSIINFKNKYSKLSVATDFLSINHFPTPRGKTQ